MGETVNLLPYSALQPDSGVAIFANMKPIDLGLIQARRKKIQTEIQDENLRHQEMIALLKEELEDLMVAERVFSRLSGGSDQSPELPLNGKGKKQTSPVGKPEGLPPVSDMIREALDHAIRLGAHGLRPSGLLSFIRGKYWPTAESKDVGPIAWRMWQNDQLEKYKSGEYALLDAEVIKIRAEIEKAAAAMPPPSPALPPPRD
jgi:hypothetical protein